MASFELVQQTDYFVADLFSIFTTGNYYDAFVYVPAHIQGNLAATYEYCNMYVYVVQLKLLAGLDYGYFSEMVTRYSLLFSTEWTPFMSDMYDLFMEDIVDWYLVGFRWGMLWKIAFDVKITM